MSGKHAIVKAPKKLLATVRQTPWLMLALIPAGAAALGLQLLAVLQIEVGLLEAIKRAGVVLSVVLAARLFGEASAMSRLPFMLLVAAGVFLLAQPLASLGYIGIYSAATLALVGLVRTVLSKRLQARS